MKPSSSLSLNRTHQQVRMVVVVEWERTLSFFEPDSSAGSNGGGGGMGKNIEFLSFSFVHMKQSHK